MKPQELFDLCMDAIDRFNRGEVFADKPFVMLTLPRSGRTVAVRFACSASLVRLARLPRHTNELMAGSMW